MKKEKNEGLQSENYLDYVPHYVEELKWEQNEKGEITLFQENKGLFNRIAQKYFHRPAVSQIHLDEMGNFVWPLINGENTIYDISQQVREAFGEKANPLYERLIQYLNMLNAYGFISLK